ncbi:amino acid adenylation domain-containing protein [Frankia sp. R82]|uniref:non-ribosomal peptide synthetase n=1 Tax=Frankia sp. R82 TaxID=2950553 RepID=UPI002043D615|nr:amino acid adenylation domain-containing protein [Frankia sp. R82]MCM3886207.1 amino acid adenylation domain-containing protein [Frankia sp. R82]
MVANPPHSVSPPDGTSRPDRAPLSGAQRRFWFLHQLDPTGHTHHLTLGLRLTGPLDVVALTAALHDVVDRHEILRTVYPPDAVGEPTALTLTRLGVDLLTVTIRDLSVDLRAAAAAGAPLDATAQVDPIDLIDPTDEGALRAVLAAFEQNPIEITDEIPLRAQLVRVGPNDHVLQLVLARIAGDEPSFEILLTDLAAGYAARCQARRAELGPPSAQYVDHARWAATAERRAEVADQLSWWREELSPPPPPLVPALAGGSPAVSGTGPIGPTDVGGVAAGGRVTVQHRVTLTPEVTGRLRALAAARGTELSEVLLAAGIVLAHRCTGQSDIAVGTCLPGRDRSGSADVAGNFDNLVVLRTRVDAQQTFGDLVDVVRERARAARAHGDAPFDEVVRAVRGETAGFGSSAGRLVSAAARGTAALGTAAGGGLVDVLVGYQPRLPGEVTLEGLHVEPLRLRTGGAGLPLALLAEDDGNAAPGTPGTPGTVTLTAVVDTGVFAAADAERFAGRLARLCEQIDAAAVLGELDTMTAAERHLVVDEWPSGRADPLVDRSLTALVADQTRRTPNAVAVVAPGVTAPGVTVPGVTVPAGCALPGAAVMLTYAELGRRAEAVAAVLRDTGVGPETTVGVCVPRSAALIVALLGVLRAGGAFVPLEPSWPARRIAEVAQNAEITAVITAADTPAFAGAPAAVLRLDLTGRLDRPDNADNADGADGADGAARTETVPRNTVIAGSDGDADVDAEPGVDLENLAYVTFTSGSTGEPKGVMIRHQAICNRLRWQVDLLRLTGDDVVLHRAPLGLDISINEIFLPLVAGARLVVAPPGAESDPGALLEIVRAHAVTFCYVATSMLEAMLDHPGAAAAGRSLRYVWCGGETMDDELYRRFRERWNAWMFHGYGPAEATIGVSCRVFEPATAAAHVTIGRPNPNTQLRVLDADYHPVPVGMVGELFVSGLPLARGYLGDPRRTADRFVPDPFGTAPGSRMYATGDLARFRADGEIEFLGRADTQVKIRGFRVELAEIEHVLGRHPGVRQAVVVLTHGGGAASGAGSGLGADESGGDELRAYWTPDPTAAVLPDAADLREWLERRLPGHMVPDVFVAAAGLPPTSGARTEHVEPAPGLQRQIADVWSQVLDATRVGARDDFFALGGHSLLLPQVQARLGRELGRRVRLAELYAHTTVEDLARCLGANPAAATGAPAGNHPRRKRI